jgi:hypothetical protein
MAPTERRKTSSGAPAKTLEGVRSIAALKNPADPAVLANLAFVYLVEQKHDAAIAILETATTRFPRDSRLLSDLAAALLTRGRAFEYAERGRARTLFDLIERGKEGLRTLTLQEVQSALPARTALLEYNVLVIAC